MSLAAKQLTNYTILGTDVSQQAIVEARLGQYDKRQQSLIPDLCQQFVQPLRSWASDISQSHFLDVYRQKAMTGTRCTGRLRPFTSVCYFALHNILKKPPTTHLQHVIICQNVLLYFRKFDQRDILKAIRAVCVRWIYYIGSRVEALFWRPSNMRRIAHPLVNVWQKSMPKLVPRRG